MVAVLTGSSGFIGSHLVDALLTAGAQVRVLARAESPEPATRAGIATYRCNLLDERSVISSPAWPGATHCFHLAGVTKARSHAAFDAGNVTPTRHLCAAIAAQARRTLRLVYVSSQAAAGPASSATAPVREDDVPRPVEAYGASKLAAELAVQRHGERFNTVIVRPAAVYGPRDRDFLAAFAQASGRLAVYAVPRANEISVVHVTDLVRALLLAAVAPMAVGRRYFVSNESPVTWAELYGEIARAAGTHPREVEVPPAVLRLAAFIADVGGAFTGRTALLNRHKVALAMPRWWHCDSTRARTELGWSARVPLADGVRETLAWYRSVGWLPPARR